ncbi:MAG: class I tRNA ligase family protein [Euryarchaeota archaeon]|jgi:valyl-tRNA synthetase|nr:class I tRNA ligase family protein [Euryarchaeota archaeon]MBT4391149.1 class I tRNA ligase family protein [Euryarchaeota archaeon]MBT4802662.1 class I tRNA ligase family protein [Euryarchaeota archaeon]MBT6684443.1 class I tRNA ligase family protein [Euryarchaeota archaeon]MBT6874712.1 class I tRNA ligase family protein [Euryarchaeota archaeon]
MNKPKISDKRWSIDLEKKIQENHYDEVGQYYSFNPNSNKELFVIDTPPPYPSGTWHIGAVAQYSMIDVIARSQRLLGKEVFFPWGVDRNGINIEFTVEKSTGRKMRSFERSEFLDLCSKTIEIFTEEMRNTAKRVGLSCDFDKEYLTDSPEYRSLTQSTFVELFKKGDIIEDLRPNIYDPVEGTTIADAEVQRVERKTKLCNIKWLTDDNEEIIITTTRPELICACGVVVVHPDDKRYLHLIGKNINLPLSVNNRVNNVKILSHPSVKMDFGSGVLMVCSFGDQNDVAIFRELGLKPFQAIDLEGKMTSISGDLSGLLVKDARNLAIEILNKEGKIDSISDHIQEIPVSERGNNPIEIILLKEWYVRQTHIQDRLFELSDKINFIPKRNKQFLQDWMDGISIDWPISRRRWYHTEIPIWYSEDETKIIVPPKGIYVQPWLNLPPYGSEIIDRDSRKFHGIYDKDTSDLGVITGENKVFDTWMDSSNSNLFVSGYMQDQEIFSKSYPTSLRPQGKEIVRTWLYYTILKNVLLLDKPAFSNVWIDGLGMDPWGRKMSKSLGNGIDANSVLECGSGGKTGSWKIKGPNGKQVQLKANKIGSECFRLWKACDAQVGDDFHINPEEIEAKYFGVLTKIFNVSRFASQFDVPKDLNKIPEDLALEDKWILQEFSEVLNKVESSWNEIDIYNAAQTIKNFSTGIFPSHWLEMAKTRLYEFDKSATWTLHRIVKDILTIFSPICPFFTHYISMEIYDISSISIQKYPILNLSSNDSDYAKVGQITNLLTEFNSLIWKTKKENNLSLKSALSDVDIPSELMILEGPLTRMHNLE